MKTKHFLQILAMLFFVFTATAQQGINYKALIDDDNGDPLVNASITIQFTILENGATNVFQETHTPSTDANGIIIVNMGEGTLISGDFNAIDWGSNPHFLKTEIDAGDGLADMGTVEFKTVPYAIHALAATHVDDADADPLNEIQTIAKTGETLTLSDGGGSVDLGSSETYSIGLNEDLGGYVFYVTPDGKHGLVASTQDASSNVNWYISRDLSDLPENFTTVGQNFRDWRLPKQWEMRRMIQHKDDIGGFHSPTYWCITEWDNDRAYYYILNTDVSMPDLKSENHFFRPVRSF